MADASQLITDFRRYADLIRAALGDASVCPTDAESATALQVERGIVYPMALLDPRRTEFDTAGRLIELSVSDRLPTMAIVDRSGHHRPVYRGLLVYSWLQAFGIVYETLPRAQFGRWEEALRIWCFLLEGELGQIDWPNGPMPAGRGSSATESAWMALALHVAGKVFVRDAWLDLASYSFGKLTQSQNGGGPFLAATPSDNPETHWYHELVLLHSAASYAVQAEDRTVAAAVARNAQWQFNETQPDHATTQPWALFAFIWNPTTRTLADQILHNVSVQPPDSAISLMLLADALYCLELFTK
ncbi:MAG TPA: hypothetical protein VH518_21075 [Tepidisphaeraceae bacterium]|jgi:hypothetical protein